jgi:hypothetical protein
MTWKGLSVALVALVVLVVFVFLKNPRSTFIPLRGHTHGGTEACILAVNALEVPYRQA